MTRVAPMLAVRNGMEAIEFYKAAFGAAELWRIDAGGSVVAGMSIGGAEFFLASENPPKTSSPDTAGTTTVRIELFVEDPEGVYDRAVAAGATGGDRPSKRTHPTVDGSSFSMIQGGVDDPFGHIWLIGKFLDD
jgi:PhnB protein